MGNCLVKKFKGIVDNDNLLPLGYIELKVLITAESSSGKVLHIGAAEKLEIILKDFTINGLDHITVSAGSTFNNSTASSWAITGSNPRMLIPKYAHYNLFGLPVCEINTDDFEYLKCPVGFKFESRNVVTGDIANMLKMFEGTTEDPTGLYFCMRVVQGNPAFEGADISALFNRKIAALWLESVKGVIGNIDNIGKSVDTLSGFEAPDDKRVTLNIENMVAIARSNGFTTGNMKFKYLGFITATFNGAELDKSVQIDTISWDATTITVRGVTIEA